MTSERVFPMRLGGPSRAAHLSVFYAGVHAPDQVRAADRDLADRVGALGFSALTFGGDTRVLAARRRVYRSRGRWITYLLYRGTTHEPMSEAERLALAEALVAAFEGSRFRLDPASVLRFVAFASLISNDIGRPARAASFRLLDGSLDAHFARFARSLLLAPGVRRRSAHFLTEYPALRARLELAT